MAPRTLWGSGAGLERRLLDLTVADDRAWDARLLRWDVLGSLGHVEGLRASGLLGVREHARLRQGLRQALAAVERGRLRLRPGAGGRAHRRRGVAHPPASRDWASGCTPAARATIRSPAISGSISRTGCSRSTRPRWTWRARCSPSPRSTGACSGRDTPISGGRCRPRSGSGPARTPKGCSTPSSRCARLWARVDRSPLGSAAGYGVPLPLRREVAAKALGFAGLDRNVATVQGGRGKLEAAALFWCTQLGHELARLSQDVILYSAEEFGYLMLPAELATGSSIMPHKRNPDLFELTRGRAAALEGDLFAVLQMKAKLSGGYHRDFQLLKEPLMRGLDRTEVMLAALVEAVPRLGVDRARCAAALAGGALATDEVMRRVEEGAAFRRAYREVAAALRRGEAFDAPPASVLVARRTSTGGLGDLGLDEARGRARRAAAVGRP